MPLAPRHHRFWAWISSLERGKYSPPFVAIWPRGGAKSSTLELGVAYVGMTLSRRFVLIVCETQEQANTRVGAIRTLLEKLKESPATTARGQQKGWRVDQIRTARGFNVAGIGLDAAARGIKLDEFRPDWIPLDDLDGLNDTPANTERKERTLTNSILGTGSEDCVVSYTQNLILEDGIAARVVGRRSDYLADAVIDGPEKAVNNLTTDIVTLDGGRREYRITGGEPTWAGQDLEVCERQIRKLGLTAFLREMQHEVEGSQGWMFAPDRIAIDDPDSPVTAAVVTMDLAATEGGGDWSVIGHFAALLNGKTWILDLHRFRLEPNGVRRAIEQFCREAYNRIPMTTFYVLDDPGQAGTYQAAQIMEDLLRAGIPQGQVATIRPTGSKAVRAAGFAEDVNAGRVGMVQAGWNEAYSTVLRGFREDGKHLYDDDVDVSSDAYNTLWRTPKDGYTPPKARPNKLLGS